MWNTKCRQHVQLTCDVDMYEGAQTLWRSFHIVSSKWLGTEASKMSLRSQVGSIPLILGAWTIFINQNPSDFDSALTFKLCDHAYTFDADDLRGRPIGRPCPRERRRIIANNPMAVADFFWVFMCCFVNKFLGWDVHTGKKLGRGWLGDITAYYGSPEEGGRANAHMHMQAAQSAFEARRLRALLQNVQFRPVLFEYMESISCMYLPSPLHDGFRPRWHPDASPLPHDDNYVDPEPSETYTFAECRMRLEADPASPNTRPAPTTRECCFGVARAIFDRQYHQHTVTCDPHKRRIPEDKDCRMVMPRVCVEISSYNEDTGEMLLRRDDGLIVPFCIEEILAYGWNHAIYFSADGGRQQTIRHRWFDEHPGAPADDCPFPILSFEVAASIASRYATKYSTKADGKGRRTPIIEIGKELMRCAAEQGTATAGTTDADVLQAGKRRIARTANFAHGTQVTSAVLACFFNKYGVDRLISHEFVAHRPAEYTAALLNSRKVRTPSIRRHMCLPSMYSICIKMHICR